MVEIHQGNLLQETKMRNLVFFIGVGIILTICKTSVGQTTGQQSSEINTTAVLSPNLVDSTATVSSASTLTIATVAPPTIDFSLPGPTGLRKVQSTQTSLTLRYEKPSDFRDDSRYSEFLVEYQRSDSLSKTNWLKQEISKLSNPRNLRITGLSGGVLYTIRIRSSMKRDTGQYILSSVSSELSVRTKPPPVSNLQAVRSASNWSEVVVSYEGAPIELFGSKYDRSVLIYYIQGLTPEQLQIYPIENVTTSHSGALFQGNRPPKVQYTFPFIPGAPYKYEVVTFSDGFDSTSSTVASISKVIDLPGPINLTETNHDKSSVGLSWENQPDINGITSYFISWFELEGESNATRNASTIASSYTITNLTPGSLYHVGVVAVREQSLFGKKTEQTIFYVRTDPLLVENLTTEHFDTSIAVTFSSPRSEKISDFALTYRPENSKETPQLQILPLNDTSKVLLTNLLPGALYQINVTSRSTKYDGLSDPTNTTASIFDRTIPSPPLSFKGYPERGTIVLTWSKPQRIYEKALWRYKIDYYAIDNRNETFSRCQAKGPNLQKVILPNLKSGTGYYLTVRTVAGETCRRGSFKVVLTQSSLRGPILVYTQPQNPRIKLWKQITLNSVRISWWPPSDGKERFDYYLMELQRVRNNSVESQRLISFEAEKHSFKINKDETTHSFQVTQGATYRVDLITVAGTEEKNSRSIVKRENTVRFTVWQRYYDHFAFSRLQWKFTTCGRSGRLGPSQLLCDSAYKQSSLEDLVILKDGIQYWTAPVDGLYRIVAAGAGYEGVGGLGATVSGLFHLKEGAVLKIGVGQRGRSQGVGVVHGGAGGTFVVADDLASQGIVDRDANEAMLVAGGAGSADVGIPNSPIANARLDHDAGNASEVGSSFGRGGIGEGNLAGPGIGGAQSTGGGAGFNGLAEAPAIVSPGDSSLPAIGFAPYYGNRQDVNESDFSMFIPLSGGRYQYRDFKFSEGGFGGGGAGYSTGVGGGGGYSGGGAGPLGGYSGGGGSYIKFTGGQQYAEVTNDQPGFVTVTVVGLPMVSPIPLDFYLAIAAVVGVVLTIVCGSCLFGVAKLVDRKIDTNEVTQNFIPAVESLPDQSYKRQNSPHPPEINASQPNDGFSSDSQTEEDASETEQEENKSEEENEPAPLQAWPSGLDKYDTSAINMDEDSNSDSVSSVSSVSSMATEFTNNKFDVNSKTGKLRYRGRKIPRLNSSFTGYESTDVDVSTIADNDLSYDDDDDDDESLPPPPPTPPLTPSPPPELVSEEQKKEFRQKLSMFHEMARKTKETPKNQPVPSTSL